MKAKILLGLALMCVLLLSVGCSDVSEQKTKADETDQETKADVTFTKQVEVFGLHIYATNTTGDDKLLHAANILAEYIDNDEDGVPDNPKIMMALLEGKGAIVMRKSEEERPTGPRPRGQGLWDEETIPDARDQGKFDASLEEILHMVTDVGWAGAYPEVFDRVPGTEISNALDKARGGRLEEVPEQYPDGAWFTYDDETCDYDCQNSEYIYWALTSILGAQDYPGRLEQIGHEWRLNTREKVNYRPCCRTENTKHRHLRFKLIVLNSLTYFGIIASNVFFTRRLTPESAPDSSQVKTIIRSYSGTIYRFCPP
jgi:hypothetical protein